LNQGAFSKIYEFILKTNGPNLRNNRRLDYTIFDKMYQLI